MLIKRLDCTGPTSPPWRFFSPAVIFRQPDPGDVGRDHEIASVTQLE